METNTTNTNTEAQETIGTPNTTPEQADNSASETPSTEVTYSEAEVASRISRAVQQALDKAKKNSDKSNAELASELAELKAELARKDNESFVATEVTKNSLPSELTDLFYGVDNEDSARKIKSFKKWWTTALETAVENKLNATPVPQLNASQPGISSANKQLGSFAQWMQDHPSK